MTPLRVAVIWNKADRRCGFANYGAQTVEALRRAGHDVLAWDGTYPAVYARREAGIESFLPPDAASFDVLHVIWHAATLNHYAGATWPQGPVLSFWNGGPSNCSCPFLDAMQVKWSCYPLAGHRDHWYPVVDWVDDLPPAAEVFTVGATSIRGDGVAEIRQVCERHGWATNLPAPDQWLPLEDEIRRLARSTINVCWYDTPDLWKDRAGAPATALASGRPLAITNDGLLAHLHQEPDLYHGRFAVRGGPDLDTLLEWVEYDWRRGKLKTGERTRSRFSWTLGVRRFEEGWSQWRAR